jgi:hypothetical protein
MRFNVSHGDTCKPDFTVSAYDFAGVRDKLRERFAARLDAGCRVMTVAVGRGQFEFHGVAGGKRATERFYVRAK